MKENNGMVYSLFYMYKLYKTMVSFNKYTTYINDTKQWYGSINCLHV